MQLDIHLPQLTRMFSGCVINYFNLAIITSLFHEGKILYHCMWLLQSNVQLNTLNLNKLTLWFGNSDLDMSFIPPLASSDLSHVDSYVDSMATVLGKP